MKHQTLKLSMLALGGLFAAQVTLSADLSTTFKKEDSNHDNMLSMQEYVAHGGTEQSFKEGDTNQDGLLSSAEFIKAQSASDRQELSQYASDTWITTKIKALLLKEEKLKGLDVNVETYRGVVQLSGWVKSSEQIDDAVHIASTVEGVKGVENDLQIKSKG